MPSESLLSTTTLTIRDAQPGDAPALAELKLATFRETFLEGFQVPYPPRDLAIFEEESYSLARVSAELADPTHHTFVAERDGRLMAYVHIGPCKLPHPDVAPGDRELYQIYLRREAQGGGLGRALLDRALAFMEHFGVPIWIGVWEGNDRARAFYDAYGFTVVGGYKFKVGAWFDDELILRRDPA